jgi:hypothetical protein
MVISMLWSSSEGMSRSATRLRAEMGSNEEPLGDRDDRHGPVRQTEKIYDAGTGFYCFCDQCTTT